MAQPSLRVVDEGASELSGKSLAVARDLTALVALSDASSGGLGRAARAAAAARIGGLEAAFGLQILDRRSGALTEPGNDLASRAARGLGRLWADMAAPRPHQPPALTVAIPAGPLGALLTEAIRAALGAEVDDICFVPSWSSAAVTFRAQPGRGDCEDVFLFADAWAAVASSAWTGERQLSARALAKHPLVAASETEAEAWQSLLEGVEPDCLIRMGREEATALVARGGAIGIANLPLLGLGSPFSRVSRRTMRPGTGLWLTLQDSTPAWDRGWDLAAALKEAFVE